MSEDLIILVFERIATLDGTNYLAWTFTLKDLRRYLRPSSYNDILIEQLLILLNLENYKLYGLERSTYIIQYYLQFKTIETRVQLKL